MSRTFTLWGASAPPITLALWTLRTICNISSTTPNLNILNELTALTDAINAIPSQLFELDAYSCVVTACMTCFFHNKA